MNANHQLFGNGILIKNFSDFQVSSIKKQNTQIYNKNNNIELIIMNWMYDI